MILHNQTELCNDILVFSVSIPPVWYCTYYSGKIKQCGLLGLLREALLFLHAGHNPERLTTAQSLSSTLLDHWIKHAQLHSKQKQMHTHTKWSLSSGVALLYIALVTTG